MTFQNLTIFSSTKQLVVNFVEAEFRLRWNELTLPSYLTKHISKVKKPRFPFLALLTIYSDYVNFNRAWSEKVGKEKQDYKAAHPGWLKP